MGRCPSDPQQEQEIARVMAASTWMRVSRRRRLWYAGGLTLSMWSLLAVIGVLLPQRSEVELVVLLRSPLALLSLAFFLGLALAPEAVLRRTLPGSMPQRSDEWSGHWMG